MNQKIGVVILNYKSKILTLDLANKISSYSFISDIVIVDNCSGDVFNKEDLQSNKIHVINNDRNTGYAGGNNVGLKYLIDYCHCDYVVIANPDVYFTNDTIQSISEAFENDEKLAICSTLRYGENGAIIHQYFDFPTFKSSIVNCFFVGRRREKHKSLNQTNRIRYMTKNMLYVDAVPGAFFGLRSSFVREIGYLYEGTFLYYEEFFIGQSARRLGYKAAIINTSMYYHNHSMSKLSKQNRKMFSRDRKSMLIYFKHFGILSTVEILLLKICVYFGSVEYYLVSSLYGLFGNIRGQK